MLVDLPGWLRWYIFICLLEKSLIIEQSEQHPEIYGKKKMV